MTERLSPDKFIPLSEISSVDQTGEQLQGEAISPNEEIMFDWMLTDACNFYCDYCHPNIAVHKNEPTAHGKTSAEIAQAFLSVGRPVHLFMSGGEPMMFPEFVDFCETITSKGNRISMNTNLSFREVIDDFSQRIDPRQIGQINAALHLMERQRQQMGIETFAEDVILLQNQGFPIDVFYVLYPPLLRRFDQDAAYLKGLGVNRVAGKIFKGPYEGKVYPVGYTDEERRIIESYKHSSYGVTADYLDGKQYKFKGKMCVAGANFFKVNVDGSVQRCPADREPYGNIYQGTFNPGNHAKPCVTRKVLSVSQCNMFAQETVRNSN